MKLYKVGLLFFFLISVGGFITAGWYVRQLEQIVTAKFEGPKWEFPSKIYSDSFFLYTGMNLRLEDLLEKLHRLGYVATRTAPKAKGEYRSLKNNGTLEIYLHDFDYPFEPFEGYPVRITLQDNVITRIERMDNQETFSVELEPELVAGLFDGVWEERELVKLDEVPPLLVQAILATEDERFYWHRGIDPVGILRALWVNVRSGEIVQGGSTLTQQLMK